MLIAGSSESAVARAKSTVAAFGVRIGDALQLADATARMQRQGSASAVWVELDEISVDDILDQLIGQINADVQGGRYGAVVSAPKELIDPLAARLEDQVELLIAPDEAERASALALALARRGTEQRYADVASDRNAERLRQLSDEVSRIAATLARLSTGPSAALRPAEAAPAADMPAVSAETVRAVIRARRLRTRYFPEELFADPAWDMLLDLLQAEISQLRVPVSSLCIAAAVPATTALRWLKTLVQQGVFVRRADPHDGRRVFVELAPAASSALRRYFAEVGKVAAI
ncbi:MAG TPA: MarR family winged helix-turn-helix transcriptional regulator [Sphingomicrobium sp.]|nr:MarR family winged helix-turn-helix transcriptional regulator [Sphingomicrobium sp.]